MKKLLILLIIVLLISCCGTQEILVEARITETRQLHKEPHSDGACAHYRYFYELVEFPLHNGRKDRNHVYHSVKSEGDTILVKIYKNELEDLINLYAKKNSEEHYE
jgi:gamma-glutamyl-gamma-aminobutyrate hydrolase PuuD